MMHTPSLLTYVKMFRKCSGLSQDEVAELLGCKHGSKVSRYERGGRLPSLEAVIALEIVFGTSTRELFRGHHERVYQQVRRRAQRLSRRVDARPLTPGVKRKMDFLVDLINQRRAAA